ncbi:MAG: helix-turn-helix domain-containing protein [Clostridiales bacterium]|nr:helix-turn-helix domain-containing protein [Clostridiales bacterium]
MGSIGWKSDLELTGENIRARRKELHMTQSEFAEELGGTVTNRVISSYECGNHEMGIQTFYDIADTLQTTPDTLAPARFREGNSIDPRIKEISDLFSTLDDSTKQIAFLSITAMLQGFSSQNS